VAEASSQLTFKTHAEFLDNVRAVVEVSPDDGTTWQAVYTEAGTRDTGFTNRSVSLGSFAGQHLRLRLRVAHVGSGSIFIGDDIGWYVDDVALTNLLAADPPVLSAVNAGTSFSFTPTQAAEYDVDVRAQFFGSGFGAWSPAKRVTATSGALSLATALDNTVLPFSSTGDALWSGQTAVSQDGVDAAKSGAIGHNQSTSLVTTVTGPTKLKFWWRSDSEAGFDFLRVTVDGVEPFAGISGNTAWQQKTISLTAGEHTVRWTYSKDDSVTGGLDAAWVDQVKTGAK
jgi:hypothetical protein